MHEQHALFGLHTDLLTERFLEVFKNLHADMFSDYDPEISGEFETTYLSEIGYSVLTEAELAEQNSAG